jgi:hypothetical protein
MSITKHMSIVLRVESDRDGTYEAHIQKTDGTEAEVKVDKNYNVTDVQTRPAHP